MQGSSIAAADRKVFWRRPAARGTASTATARWMRRGHRGHPRRPSLRSLVVPPTRGTSSVLVVMEMKVLQRCRGSVRTAHRCLILIYFNGRNWFWWYQQLDDKHMAHENLKPSRIDQHLKRYLTLFDTIWHYLILSNIIIIWWWLTPIMISYYDTVLKKNTLPGWSDPVRRCCRCFISCLQMPWSSPLLCLPQIADSTQGWNLKLVGGMMKHVNLTFGSRTR